MPWSKVGAGFIFLADDNVYPDHRLPATGVPMVWERLYFTAFVKAPTDGTRSSTVRYRW